MHQYHRHRSTTVTSLLLLPPCYHRINGRWPGECLIYFYFLNFHIFKLFLLQKKLIAIKFFCFMACLNFHKEKRKCIYYKSPTTCDICIRLHKVYLSTSSVANTPSPSPKIVHQSIPHPPQSSPNHPQYFPTMHGSSKGQTYQDKVIVNFTSCSSVTDLAASRNTFVGETSFPLHLPPFE